MLKIYKYLKRRIFPNKLIRNFNKKLSIAPEGCDLNENIYAFRYLCHQLEKTIKNSYDKNNVRGIEKYNKARSILNYLEKTHWRDSVDVKWGKNVLNNYEKWKKGSYKNVLKKIEFNRSYSNDFEKIIFSRKSIRYWTDGIVPKELILKILEMGTAAPTSCNRQSFRFIVVENSNTQPLDKNVSNRALISKAPYIIYVTFDRRLYPEKYAPALDAGIVSQNILLAIEYFGLGSCPMYHCEAYNQKKIREILGLEKNFYIYLAIPFGIPAENPLKSARVSVDRVTSIIKVNSSVIANKM